jgi:hypothetical protein
MAYLFVDILLSREQIELIIKGGFWNNNAVYFMNAVPIDCEHALQLAEEHNRRCIVYIAGKFEPATLENMLKLKAQLLNE